jgi:hypothetical protein
MSGFITLHRKLLDWEWYSDINTKTLFIHCLLKANWEDKNWRGIDVKRGSFVTSYDSLSKETKLTIQQIRTSIFKLTKTQEINIQTTNKFTLLTIVKYEDYQSLETKPTHKQQTNNKQTNKQITTTNNINNNNHLTNNNPKENNIEERKLKFASTLEVFLPKYGREMLNEFYKYWTEPNNSNTKFRKELEKTWSAERRLETWSKNKNNFKKEKGSAEKEKEKPMIGRMTQESVEKTFNAFLNVEANG